MKSHISKLFVVNSCKKSSNYQLEPRQVDPLSAIILLFIIVLDKSPKEVHHLAIINQNIQDEKKISPLPVLGFADDTTFISYFENVLKSIFVNS